MSQAANLRRHLDAFGIEIARPYPPLSDRFRITVGLPTEHDRVIAALGYGDRHKQAIPPLMIMI
ncbi:hypothetical protein [Sphingomonas sp. IW22]|uniref:hypothetical protein n=1 Tax=Sphingomonas sp. IW22 TaxID=3242489 RepID=UPI00352130E7